MSLTAMAAPAASTIVVRPAAEPAPAVPETAPAFAHETHALEGHGAGVTSVVFLPCGRFLLTASADRRGLLWDLSDGELPAALALGGARAALTAAAVLADGVTAAVAAADGELLLHDLASGARTGRVRAHAARTPANDVAAADPHTLLSAGNDRAVRAWDTRARRRPAGECTLPAPALAAAWLGAHRAASAALDGAVRVHDLRRLAAPAAVLAKHDGHAAGAAPAPAGAALATAGPDAVRVTDARPFVGEGARARAVCRGAQVRFEPSLVRPAWGGEHCVAAGGADGVVRVWDARDGVLVAQHAPRAGAVNAVAFHPQLPVIAAAGDDKAVHIGPAGIVPDDM